MILKMWSQDLKSESESNLVVSDSLGPHGLYSPWKSPGQEYRSGYPFPSPGNLPKLEVEPRSPIYAADSLPTELSISEALRPANMLKYEFLVPFQSY